MRSRDTCFATVSFTGAVLLLAWTVLAPPRVVCAAGSAIKKEVCVLGGGASGSFTAWELQKRGYEVLLVEPRSELGGNCDELITNSAVDPAVSYITHLGVVIFSNSDVVRNFFEDMGQPAPVYPPRTGPVAVASTGAVFPRPPCDEACQAALNGAVAAFATIMNSPPYLGPDGSSLCGGLVPDFSQIDESTRAAYFQTFGEFMSEHPELLPIQSILLVLGQGCGPPGLLPMWELCLAANPRFLQGFLQREFLHLPNGCQAVYDTLASRLQEDDPSSVLLNTNVLNIRRKKGRNRVKVKVSDGSTTTRYNCGSVFIAFRPKGIEGILKGMTDEEVSFFGDLGYPNRAYFTSAWRMTPNAQLAAIFDASNVQGTEFSLNFADASMTEPGVAGSLDRFGVGREHENRTYSLLYNYDNYDATEEETDTIKSEMKSILERMGFEDVTNEAFELHPFCIRPESDDKLLDFYGFANRINYDDDDNLYWIGATYSGEGSERVWEHALNILDEKFSSRRRRS